MNLKRDLLNLFWRLQPAYTSLSVAGRRFRVPLQRGADRAALAADREPWLAKLFQNYAAKPESVLLDIGANCGQTLLLAKAIHPAIRYFGVEPNPTAAGYVQSLIAANELTGATVIAAALSNHDGVADLFAKGSADPSATLIPNFRGSETGPWRRATLTVRGDSLVSWLAIDRLDLVKIDVEGAEAAVLEGLSASIQRFRPAIVCEILRSHDPSHASHAFRVESKRRVAAVLESANYAAHRIDGNTITRTTEFADDCLNYLLLPD